MDANLLLNGTSAGCGLAAALVFVFEDVVIARSALQPRAFGKSQCGFSLVELVVSIVILMILSAISIPTLTRAYRSYVLSDSTSRFAGLVKLTRFEAIRRNRQVKLQVQLSGTTWAAWADVITDNTPNPTENQIVLAGMVGIIPAPGSPSGAPIAAAIGSSPTVLSGNTSSVTYDARGAVNFGGGPAAVYAYYLGNPTIPDLGARAVILLPSGIVQVWSSSSGTWKQVS